MTPEESFNRDVWSLLQEIKMRILRAPEGSAIDFYFETLPDLKWNYQLDIIAKLTEWRILDNDWVFEADRIKKVILSIHQPEFDQLYNKFKYEFSPKIIEKEVIREIPEQKKEAKNKFPYKLPAGTRWENIIIKFLDDENVLIKVKQFKHRANYKDMGFRGAGKDPGPSQQWGFFKVLAGLNGELGIKDPEAKDKYRKQKELLGKALQEYFSIDYDPFYPYRSSSEKKGNSYKIKSTLIPPEIKQGEDPEDDSDSLGLQEHLREEAPEVYEDR